MLSASSLFSKFGFNDGELVWDWLFNHEDYWDVDDRAVLVRLVKSHLVSALEVKGFDFTVYELETNHNPIRIDTWNGEKWDDRVNAPDEVRNLYVDVPEAVVWDAIEEVG